jgi:hypothetical protein
LFGSAGRALPSYAAAEPGRGRGCLLSEAILEPGVAELVSGPDGAQHVAVSGILQEAHEMGGSAPARGSGEDSIYHRGGEDAHPWRGGNDAPSYALR